ncbi:hypothetical protein E6R18_32855 [Streptomyces sp. A1277]|uniref:hypothetical protein n=1 Tax=Streptomyces sp. A1277 TaxID=2563103 RepID=UPI0010A22E7C|nr:hypothetical protein [Streptomyces sp. A1277]THA22738.1 hypothetical protein E6R18_32855 [Streptomyces sp. A1277]
MTTQPAPAQFTAEQITALADTLYDALYAITPFAEPHFADENQGLENAVRAVLTAATHEAQQPETEAHPTETEWVLETLWRTNGEWRRHCPARTTRDEAEQDHERSITHDPSRQYRIVRVVTTSTAEPAPHECEEPTL